MPNQLKNHHLLSNGIKMPLIGYGTFPYKEELLDCIPAALNLGYELIDTSDDYHNYHYVGEALNKLRGQKRVLLQTKISWPVSPATIRKRYLKTGNNLSLGIIL